jgi:carboxyl-terminal processing protease
MKNEKPDQDDQLDLENQNGTPNEPKPSQSYLSAFIILVVLYSFFSYLDKNDQDWEIDVNRPSANAKDLETKIAADYKIGELNTLNEAIVHIEDSYVEPHRINRPKMIAAALEEIQKEVPEVLVEVIKDSSSDPAKKDLPKEIIVSVREIKKKFIVDPNVNRYQLLFVLKDAISFIQSKVKHFKKLAEIEYAAINGMLSTLDPHSALLSPEAYADMKVSTDGKFGGLGIVIGNRDGALTVINPIPNTPASRAGIKAGDKIVQINLDSTINMSLQDAVDMMRGEPGTHVDIYVMREDWKSPKKFSLKRAQISVQSAPPIKLSGGIGLLHSEHFQGNTTNELNAAIKSFKADGPLKGFILDLRDNPGGLLNQAVSVSDLFIESGTIVKTVGYGDKVQEPKMAVKEGTLSDLPVVVLINQGSASASEIVAGALKNHQRALLIGQKSFGKGSVQLVFENKDASAVKITIAQYLTPGDVSIQSVGIQPHIALEEMMITKDGERYFYHPISRGEENLPEHLSHESSKYAKADQSIYRLSFLQDEEVVKKKQERPSDLIVDFEIELAQQILQNTKSASLKDLLEASEKIVAEQKEKQNLKLKSIFKEKNIEWTSDVNLKNDANLQISYQLNPADGVIKAGESLEVTVKVKNIGTQSVDQLHGISFSRNDALEGFEFILGTILANEEKSWKTTIKTQPYYYGRKDEMEIKFARADQTAEESKIPSIKIPVEIVAYPDPYLKLNYYVDDQTTGDKNGLLSAGEEANLVMSYRNEGEGSTIELVGSLGNEGKEHERGLFIKRGRISPEKEKNVLKKGDQDQMTFEFKVKGSYQKDINAVINLYDAKVREGSLKKIVLPVIDSKLLKTLTTPKKLAPKSNNLSIFVQPCEKCDVIDSISQSVVSDACVLNKRNKDQCDWYRVKDQKNRLYWVNAIETVDATTQTDAEMTLTLNEKFLYAPPMIKRLDPIIDAVTEKNAQIKFEIDSVHPLQDVMIYVNQRKVYYKSSEDMTDPKKLLIDMLLPLDDGENKIMIYARESEDVVSQEVFVIHRPDGEKEKTRKYF